MSENPRPDPADWDAIVAAIKVADEDQRMTLSWSEVIDFRKSATPEQLARVARDAANDPRVADAVAETIPDADDVVALLGRPLVEATARRWLRSDNYDDGWAVLVAESLGWFDLDVPESVERFKDTD